MCNANSCLQLAQCNEMIAAAEENRKSGTQEKQAAFMAAQVISSLIPELNILS